MSTEETLIDALPIVAKAKKNWHKGKYLLVGILVLILIIGLMGAYVVYKNWRAKNNQVQVNEETEKKLAEAEAKELQTEVGKLMVLPSDELPTIATVSDIEKLRDQLFFQKAKNGDKVLIFTDAKTAVLYDPIAKKIINVGPLNETAQQTETRAQPAKVVIRNGTTVPRLTLRAEAELLKNFPGIQIIKREQANGVNYTSTVVVALKPEAQIPASLLAQFYTVSVSELPKEESMPQDADVLIILGKEYANLTQTPPMQP